jgi:LCP family protein required for cell wall assembly
MQRTIIGVGIVVLVAIVAGVAAVGYGLFRFNQINKEKLSLTKVGASEPQNFLIVGSDSRASIDKSDPDYKAFNGGGEATGGQRSDTIIIMRVDPKAHSVDMVSLPRDLWVPISGTGDSQRINTAYSLSNGRQRLIDTIQEDFGVPINHYVEVDFAGFKGVVDAIDGVPMYFDKAMRDNNSGLNITAPGCVTLDGEQAIAFARSRHLEYKDPKTNKWKSDPTGDLGRITRQQVFMRKVVDRSAGKATSLDLVGTNNLINAAVKNLTVDSAFGVDTMLALGRQFKSFTGDQMVSHALPTTPFTTSGGAAVLRLDQAGAQPIFDLFKGANPTPQSKPSDVTLSVRNSGAAGGAAGKAQAALQTLGFTVSGADTGAAAVSHSQVRYGSGAQDKAALVARHVKGGADATEDPALAADDVRLVLGKDFVGIIDDAGKTVSGTTAAATGGRSTTTTASPVITDAIGEAPGATPEGVTCG